MEPSSVTITEGNAEVENKDNTTSNITTDDPVDCNDSHCNHCTDDHSQAEPEIHISNAENTSVVPSSVTITEESSKGNTEVESEDNIRPTSNITTDEPVDCNDSHCLEDDHDIAAYPPVQASNADDHETTPCNTI